MINGRQDFSVNRVKIIPIIYLFPELCGKPTKQNWWPIREIIQKKDSHSPTVRVRKVVILTN